MKFKKHLAIFLKILGTLLVWFIAGWVLNYYEFFIAFKDIDNILGLIPIVLLLVGNIGLTFIFWNNHSKIPTIINIEIILIIIISFCLFPVALRKNWWINLSIEKETEVSSDSKPLSSYDLVELEEQSNLQISSDFPILDGATALFPVYAAFAMAVYDEKTFSKKDLLCTNTRNAYESIIAGSSDIIFVAKASNNQIAAAKAAGADLYFTPIGREAFVFLVGKENPLNSITYQQIRNIYSGKTNQWHTIGADLGKIIAFQRPEGSGSQTGLQNIMGNLSIQVSQPLPDPILIGNNRLLEQVSVKWKGLQPAIGYSYRYYATKMYPNPNAKLLKINGIEPSVENIQKGLYPFTGDFYAVTNGEPKGNTKLLIDWILSEQGQKLIEKIGYVPIWITEERNDQLFE